MSNIETRARGVYKSLVANDFLKGLVMAILAAAITGLYAIFSKDTVPTWMEWRQVGLSAISSGLGYLLKNLYTNSQGDLLTKEPGAVKE